MKQVRNIIIGLLFSNLIFAQLLSIQGIARDNAGASLADGTYNFTFRAYSALTGGTADWTEAQSLTVTNGVFSTNLGAVTSMSGLNFNNEYFLSIEIGTNGELSPRTKLTMTPYAIMAQLSGSTNVIPAAGSVGFGTTSPQTNLSVIGNVRGANATDETEYVEIGHGGRNGYINTVGDGNLNFRHDGSTLMTLMDNGRLGIGTTSPGAKLDVDGNARIRGSFLNIWGGSNELEGAQINLKDAQSNSDGQTNAWILDNYNDEFRIMDDGAVRVEIDPIGNVGIGTNPTHKLTVNGDIKANNIMYKVGENHITGGNGWGIGVGNLDFHGHGRKYKVFYQFYLEDHGNDSQIYVRFNGDTGNNYRSESMMKFWQSGSGAQSLTNGISLGRNGWSQPGDVSGEFTVQKMSNDSWAFVTGTMGFHGDNTATGTGAGKWKSPANITHITVASQRAKVSRGYIQVYAIP